MWAQTFKYLADQKVLFEGILLKPAMVTPGADSSVRATPDQVADYTLRLLRRRVPPAVPGAMHQGATQLVLCRECSGTASAPGYTTVPARSPLNPWPVLCRSSAGTVSLVARLQHSPGQYAPLPGGSLAAPCAPASG